MDGNYDCFRSKIAGGEGGAVGEGSGDSYRDTAGQIYAAKGESGVANSEEGEDDVCFAVGGNGIEIPPLPDGPVDHLDFGAIYSGCAGNEWDLADAGLEGRREKVHFAVDLVAGGEFGHE